MSTEENTPDEINFDLKKKKKSKKRLNQEILAEVTEHQTNNDVAMEDGDFTYDFLITRVFDMIRQSNPGLQEDHQVRIVLPPPQVARVGTKRTSFINFGATCKILKRPEKVLLDFFVVELGTTASIDANHALIIRGRLAPKHIENILRSFLREYVICKTCRSPDTLMKKEERLTVIVCNSCHSKYSVSNIRAGIQVQHGRRSADT